MGRSRDAARTLVAVVGALLLAGGTAVAASSAAPPEPVTISALQVDGTTITGILSVSQATTAIVDNTTLTAVIGGRSYPVRLASTDSVKRATMIVVDTSGSMGAAGMATVRSAVTSFLTRVPRNVSVGITSFADRPRVVLAPTLDRAAARKAVDGLTSGGETSLYDGILAAAAAMTSFESRTMVLLSDGGDTVSKAAASDASRRLRQDSIWTAVVGFRTADSDNKVLSSFASASDGKVAAASSPVAVNAAFMTSAKALTAQIAFTVSPGREAADATTLVVTGRAGGRIFQTQAPIAFAKGAWGDAPATAPVDVHAAGGSLLPNGISSRVLTVALGCVGVGVFVLALALSGTSLKSRRATRVESIERYLSPQTRAAAADSPASASALSQGMVQLGERVMSRRDSTAQTMRLIERADLPLRAGEWWVLRLVAVVLGSALAAFLLGSGSVRTPVGLLVGAVVGYLLPQFVLKFLARRRCKKFEAQLPDVLMLLASSLSTGFSLPQGLDSAARDAAEPLAKEFSRALAETRIGLDLSDALERMSDRMDSTNMRWTAMAIRIQREVGGNLAETLRTTAGTLREREMLNRQVRALSAEGRLSAYILIAMPIGVFLYMLKVNYDYVSLLWTRSIGVGMLVGGVVFLGIAIVWLRKVIQVEV